MASDWGCRKAHRQGLTHLAGNVAQHRLGFQAVSAAPYHRQMPAFAGMTFQHNGHGSGPMRTRRVGAPWPLSVPLPPPVARSLKNELALLQSLR